MWTSTDWMICSLIFWALYICWILITYQMNSWQRLPLIFYLSLHSGDCSLFLSRSFNLMQSRLSTLVLTSCAIGVPFRLRSPSASLVLLQYFQSLRSYVKAFDPLIKLIFTWDKRQGSSFSLWHVDIQFSQHYLWGRLSFLQCMFLASFFENQMDLFLGPLFCSPGLVCLFLCQYHTVFVTMAL
jgi:hypothetical protein